MSTTQYLEQWMNFLSKEMEHDQHENAHEDAQVFYDISSDPLL